jgi:predicted oxidoreductase
MPNNKYDALIIGGGIAGLILTYELLEKGKTICLLDRKKREDLGGLAKLAFGGMAFVDTPAQRKSGIQDSPELALGDWCSFANFSEEDVWPRRWAEYYVKECTPKVYHWLQEKGLKFFPAVNWVERGQYHRGNSVPRYHVLWGTGYRLVERFIELIESHPNRKKLDIFFEHRVDELLNDSRRVNACIAYDEVNERQVTFKADYVAIATGGINGTLDNVRKNWYRPWGEPPAELLNGADPAADGRVHDAVANQGGKLTHLDKMWNYAAGIPHPKPHFKDHGLSLIPCKSALWLDFSGKRIGPEPLVTGFDTNELCRRVSQLDKPHTWQLLNWRIAAKEFAISGSEHNPHIRDRKLIPFLKEVLLGNHRLVSQMAEESDHFIVADTLPELVSKMNALDGNNDVTLDAIENVVNDYDEMIKRGKAYWNDDQLRRIQHARSYRSDKIRTCNPKPILDEKSGPLIAIKLRLISRKSLGGIQTDLSSRVLDTEGNAIDGLFAIGEAAGFGGGGASGFKSLEGTFLSGCILTARAAADAIV